jgi:hypothetical protein
MIQRTSPFIKKSDLINVCLAKAYNLRGQVNCDFIKAGYHTSKLNHRLRDVDAVFCQMTPQIVYQLGALADKQLMVPKILTTHRGWEVVFGYRMNDGPLTAV